MDNLNGIPMEKHTLCLCAKNVCCAKWTNKLNLDSHGRMVTCLVDVSGFMIRLRFDVRQHFTIKWSFDG